MYGDEPLLDTDRVQPEVTAVPPLETALAWANTLLLLPDPVRRAVECAQKLGLPAKELRDCRASACGDTGAVLLDAIGECAGDTCAGHTYLLSADSRSTRLPLRGHKACAPDGSFVVADVVLVPAREGAAEARRWSVVLHKYAGDGSPPSLFADCMSPLLAPDGSVFLCRNREGDLLTVPLSGGPTQVVARADAAPGKLTFRPQADRYPAPPRIESGVVYFDLDLSSGAAEREVLWPLLEAAPAAPHAPAAAAER